MFMQRDYYECSSDCVRNIVPNSEISKYFDREKILGNVTNAMNKISVGPTEIQRPKNSNEIT